MNRNTWLLSLCRLYKWATENNHAGIAAACKALIMRERIG